MVPQPTTLPRGPITRVSLGYTEVKPQVHKTVMSVARTARPGTSVRNYNLNFVLAASSLETELGSSE
jgi:hypothetical protein